MLKLHQWLCSQHSILFLSKCSILPHPQFVLWTSKLNTLYAASPIVEMLISPWRADSPTRRGQISEMLISLLEVASPSYPPSSSPPEGLPPSSPEGIAQSWIYPAGESLRSKQEKSLLPGNSWHYRGMNAPSLFWENSPLRFSYFCLL